MKTYHYISETNQQKGPHTFEQLQELARTGGINDDTWIASPGDKAWRRWREVRGGVTPPPSGAPTSLPANASGQPQPGQAAAAPIGSCALKAASAPIVLSAPSAASAPQQVRPAKTKGRPYSKAILVGGGIVGGIAIILAAIAFGWYVGTRKVAKNTAAAPASTVLAPVSAALALTNMAPVPTNTVAARTNTIPAPTPPSTAIAVPPQSPAPTNGTPTVFTAANSGQPTSDGFFWVEGEKDKPHRMWLLSAQSDKPTLLASDAGIWYLTLSPDKRMIAYAAFTTNESARGFLSHDGLQRVVNTKGQVLFSSQDARTRGGGGFSPNSRFYAFGRPDPKATNSTRELFTLCVFDFQQSKEYQIAKGVQQAQWVPDSTGMLFQTTNAPFDLFHAVVPQGNPEKLFSHVASYSLSTSNPWVHVLIEATASSASAKHWLLNVSNRQRFELSAEIEKEARGLVSGLGRNPQYKNSTWSPKGNRFAATANGVPAVFDCESTKTLMWTNAGTAEEVSFSRQGEKLAFILSQVGTNYPKVGFMDCRNGKQSTVVLGRWLSKVRGWLGDSLVVSSDGKLYRVHPDEPPLLLMEETRPLESWRWPQRQDIAFVRQTGESMHVLEMGTAGVVRESFPAMGRLSINFTNAGMMTRWDMGLAGLELCSPAFYRTETEYLGYSTSTKFILTDLRFALVPIRSAEKVVVSVKEKGKPCAQYLLHRDNPVAEKIGDLAGALPMEIEGQERVLFRVGDTNRDAVALHLYDLKTKKWTKLADSIAPIGGFTLMLTEAGREGWRFQAGD